MNEWMSLVVSWLPFLVLIALWFWFSRRNGMQARGSSGATMIELYEQQVAETRRMNVFLEVPELMDFATLNPSLYLFYSSEIRLD